MLRAGCWRVRISNSRDVADPTGDLSGRLAEEVNRRPLFCRAGHRRGSNGSDPVFVDRSTACPAPLLLGPSEDSADPKSGKPLRGCAPPKQDDLRPPGTQTPKLRSAWAHARDPTFMITRGGAVIGVRK